MYLYRDGQTRLTKPACIMQGAIPFISIVELTEKVNLHNQVDVFPAEMPLEQMLEC